MAYRRGQTHGRAKLSNRRVRRARQLRAEGWSYHALAVKYGVAESTMRLAVQGKHWRHLK
jgi:hypothetical protein